MNPNLRLPTYQLYKQKPHFPSLGLSFCICKVSRLDHTVLKFLFSEFLLANLQTTMPASAYLLANFGRPHSVAQTPIIQNII